MKIDRKVSDKRWRELRMMYLNPNVAGPCGRNFHALVQGYEERLDMTELSSEEVRAELKAAGIDINGPKVVGKLLKLLANALSCRDMAFAYEKKSYLERYKIETERDEAKAEIAKLRAACQQVLDDCDLPDDAYSSLERSAIKACRDAVDIYTK